MRHFYRTQLTPADALAVADEFFPRLDLAVDRPSQRSRTFSGALGVLALHVKPEGGHYTFVEAATDQVGESRLDKNVKKFFVELHRREDPAHKLAAGY